MSFQAHTLLRRFVVLFFVGLIASNGINFHGSELIILRGLGVRWLGVRVGIFVFGVAIAGSREKTLVGECCAVVRMSANEVKP